MGNWRNVAITVKPRSFWKVYHNRQGHVAHFPFLIFLLKVFKELASLYSSSKFADSEDVLNFIVFWPYLNVFLCSLDIIWKFRILWAFSWNVKKLSIIGGLRRLIMRKTSVINKSSKLLFLSLLTTPKDLSWIFLIRLLDFLEQNIQIKGQ